MSPPELTEKIITHYNEVFDLPGVSSGAKASVIGKIRKDKQYIVHNNGGKIIDALAEEVTKGFLYDREHKKPDQEFHEPSFSSPLDHNEILKFFFDIHNNYHFLCLDL